MEVYKKVKTYIEKNGYKQSAVARKTGISDAAFGAMMNGSRTMHADDLRAVCLALNVSPEVFIDTSNG